MYPNTVTVHTIVYVVLTHINLLTADRHDLLPKLRKVTKVPAKQYFPKSITGSDIPFRVELLLFLIATVEAVTCRASPCSSGL